MDKEVEKIVDTYVKMQEKNILIIIGNTDKIGDIILHD
jgi:hypothetical protein